MSSEREIMRSLVRLIIEKTLLEIGKPTLDKTVEYLRKNYNCQLQDCYEHPEYLGSVLQHIFGKGGQTIVKSIKTQLEEYSYDNKIALMIKTING